MVGVKNVRCGDMTAHRVNHYDVDASTMVVLVLVQKYSNVVDSDPGIVTCLKASRLSLYSNKFVIDLYVMSCHTFLINAIV